MSAPEQQSALVVVEETATHLTHDEIAAIFIVVVVLLSVAWDTLWHPMLRLLQTTCVRDFLLKLQINAEAQAELVAMGEALHAQAAKLEEKNRKARKAASVMGKKSVGEVAEVKKVEIRGRKYGVVGMYAPELIQAEKDIERAKAIDRKTAKAQKPKEPPRKPQPGVRGQAYKVLRGKKTIAYPGDGVYDGEFVDGLKQGNGKFFSVDGNVYEGQFLLDQKHGHGKETYADGGTYEGAFDAGTRHGMGTLQYANLDCYEGMWDRDVKEGLGTFRWVAGTIYEGEFHEGVMHGQGTYYFADGCTYQGQYADGKRHGRGTYRFIDGSYFEGEYVNGVVTGRGTFTFPDGSAEVGRWEDGWPVGEATRFSPDHKHAWRLMDGHVTGEVSLEIADVIGRMAFKPKPWERAARLARAMSEKLAAIEMGEHRNDNMATVYHDERGARPVPERLEVKPEAKKLDLGQGAVFTKHTRDIQGRLLPTAKGFEKGSPEALGAVGGGATDAYAAYKARVHADSRVAQKKTSPNGKGKVLSSKGSPSSRIGGTPAMV